jgi:hypothetical protein
MFDRVLAMLIDTNLLLLGAAVLVLLSIANEAGFRLGLWRTSRRPAADRDLAGISTITTGMLGLLAFTLGLTINIAQNRYEARRALVVQEANAIGTAWLRAKLPKGDEGPAIDGLIEAYARVQLAYITAASTTAEPALIARTNELQTQLWGLAQTVARRDPTPISVSLVASLNDMFDATLAQRFAFDSQVPANMSWMLMAGSLLAIGAMGYHLGSSGSRQVVLTSLLLVMWAGAMVLIADLNRPRSGAIRVDPAPMVWTMQGFAPAHAP